jgi:glutathione synthase/RimK-type ligase-like ATP-grasp enzyme
MKYLIPTEPDDAHAALVKCALEERGHQVTLMFTADQPTRLRHSVYVDSEGYQWKSEDPYHAIVENQYDVVWWRRARKPYVPKALMHQDDYVFTLRENTLFFDAFTHNLAPNAWWINPKEAAHRANHKLLQLKYAQECGLSIPITLCSNDPKEIHYFLLAHEAAGVVYKPLCPHFWVESQHIKIPYTARLAFVNLPSDTVLQAAPGLFQREIRKQYELRITCFGDYCVAAKLNSQAHPDGQVDWRAIRGHRLQVEPYEISAFLRQQLRDMMQRLGIVFGCFDFIVTPEHEYVFLEVNEQGQFLWLEECNSDFRMLDWFVDFLENREVNPIRHLGQTEHGMMQYMEQMHALLTDNKQRHVNLNNLKE